MENFINILLCLSLLNQGFQEDDTDTTLRDLDACLQQCRSFQFSSQTKKNHCIMQVIFVVEILLDGFREKTEVKHKCVSET